MPQGHEIGDRDPPPGRSSTSTGSGRSVAGAQSPWLGARRALARRLARRRPVGRGPLDLEDVHQISFVRCSDHDFPVAIRASARTLSMKPSGRCAEGEAPGCAGAIRTRRTPGRIPNRSGGSSRAASPSIPAGTGSSASTSNVGALHSRTAPAAPTTAFAAARGRAGDRDPEQTVVDRRAGAGTDGAPEPVAVVRDEHQLPNVLVPAGSPSSRSSPAPEGPSAAGPSRQRPELRVAVAGGWTASRRRRARRCSRRRRSPREIDRRSKPSANASRAPTTSSRSTPRSSAKWFRVPAGTHDERQVVLGASGDERLRAVAAGHADHVGARATASRPSRPRSSPGLEHDRLDARAPAPRPVRTARPCRRPTSG